MGHAGDTTIAGARTCPRDIIRSLQVETIEGIIGGEHHHAGRGFGDEAGEAKGPDNRAADGKDRARLGRHRRGGGQGNTTIRVGGEGLVSRERPTVQLDAISHSSREGRTEGTVGARFHRTTRDDGVTRVGIGAGETQDRRDAARTDGVVLGVRVPVGARLDEVGRTGNRAGEVQHVRGRITRRWCRGRDIDREGVARSRTHIDVTHPGLAAAAVAAEGRVVRRNDISVERQEIAIGRDPGAIGHGDGPSTGGVAEILEDQLALLDVEVDVLRLGTDVDDARAHLGQREARPVDDAVVTRAFDATDVEATTRTADGGVAGEGQVSDASRGIKCRGAGVDEHPEAANASADEVQVDVAGTKDTRSEILAVQVERGAIGYRDERAFREGLL